MHRPTGGVTGKCSLRLLTGDPYKHYLQHAPADKLTAPLPLPGQTSVLINSVYMKYQSCITGYAPSAAYHMTRAYYVWRPTFSRK